jgi:DNA-binding NtrC family response regulator
MADILVVDDDQSIAVAFERFLDHEGHTCRLASSAGEALAALDDREPDLVVMDVRMPGVDGLQALEQIRARHPSVYVAIMTAFGTSQTSIDAIRIGAFEYLTKPLDLDQLRTLIARALHAKKGRERAASMQEGQPAQSSVNLVGDTPAMQEVYKMIGRLATNDVPAVVTGARGTGKELVVATIHQNSARRDQPFVTLDCPTLSDEAFEAELAAPRGGTLHLASVEALTRQQQARLLKAMREGRAKAARGETSPRILASTEGDLAASVDRGEFLRELYEILAVVVLPLPALRDRREDIPLLVRHFIHRFNEELDRAIRGVDDQVIKRLTEHPWPGNVGELESVLKRACIVTRSDVITLDDVSTGLAGSRFAGRQDVESALSRAARVALQERLVEHRSGTPSSVFHDIVGLVEEALVREALAITNGNQVKASELLGVNRATLRKKAASES